MNVKTKKISLNRETVRHLSTKDLHGVAGGRINLSRVTECDCPSGIRCPDPVPASAVNTSCACP